jgi:hypothetical protein
MNKSIGLSSQFVVALIVIAILSAASVAQGDARPVRHQSSGQASASQTHLPESTVLVQHDDVLPTQNRTQAMVLESENGHLPAGEESELKRRGFVQQVNQAHSK